jgi:hypothetical protein
LNVKKLVREVFLHYMRVGYILNKYEAIFVVLVMIIIPFVSTWDNQKFANFWEIYITLSIQIGLSIHLYVFAIFLQANYIM